MDTEELTEMELQVRMLEVLEKQERHLKFFSIVVSVYIVLQVVAIGSYLLLSAMP